MYSIYGLCELLYKNLNKNLKEITFHKTRQKRDPSPLFKTGRKQDKLEKPGRKRGKRPKIPRIGGEQMLGRKHEETGK
jgi:hypothetical protein